MKKALLKFRVLNITFVLQFFSDNLILKGNAKFNHATLRNYFPIDSHNGNTMGAACLE